MNIEEAKESGLKVIDDRFDYFLTRYLNAHRYDYKNSYDFGEAFIMDLISRIDNTKITNKYQFIRAIRWTMKDFNVEKYRKAVKNGEVLKEKKDTSSIPLVGVYTVEDLKDRAIEISLENPSKYIFVYTIFQEAYAVIKDYISVKAPGDYDLDGYWKNGKFNKFSKKQLDDYERDAQEKGGDGDGMFSYKSKKRRK